MSNDQSFLQKTSNVEVVQNGQNLSDSMGMTGPSLTSISSSAATNNNKSASQNPLQEASSLTTFQNDPKTPLINDTNLSGIH